MSGHDAFKLIEEDGRIRNFGNHVAKDFEFVPDQSVLRGKVNNHSSNAYAFIRLKNGKIIYQWATDSDSNLWSNLPKSELIKNGKVLSTAVCESEADLQSNLARFGCSPVQIEQLMAGVKFFRSSRQLSFNCHT